MQPAPHSSDFEVNLAALKRLVSEQGGNAGGSSDSLPGTLARLDASHIIAVVDSLGHPAGSPANISLYRKWLELVGGASASAYAIWFNLGVQYAATDNLTDRITCYENALALKPTFYQAAVNLGLAHEAAGKNDLALATWHKNLQTEEARIALLNHRGRVLENLKQLDEADAVLTASLLTKPDQPDVLHHIIGLRTKMCTWPLYGLAVPGVTHDHMVAATRALTVMAVFDDTAHLCRANRSWIDEKMPPAPAELSTRAGYGHERIRIGYLSSDFCMHPVAYLVAELIERHDRNSFEIYGYCSTKDDGSAVRRRVLDAFDKHVLIRDMSDEQAAHAIRQDEIDILIDLNGLTLGTRLQILRWRPAPIQMTYLGYNGPIPLPELDYIIADEYVIPRSMAANYEPKPLYLPDCFQVNDSHLPIAPAMTREAVGLPEDRFVFCSFSNTYKVTEPVFDGWIEILRRSEDAVLWMFVDNPYAMKTLTARAVAAGLDGARIIFASRVEASVYRSRLALADLFLDTYPYNSGVTASDALRVGLPLITLSGETFVSRMAGSLLKTMGLEDGIADDLDSYVALAVTLATDETYYKQFRDRVTPARWAETLGNTKVFCRTLELALQGLVQSRDALAA